VDQELLRQALDAFNLGTPRQAVASVARGAMGEIFEVVTDRGRYALKQLFGWNDGSGARQEMTFTARARAAGVLVPAEVVGLDGEPVAVVRGTRFRAYEWFDLGAAFVPPVTVAVATSVGTITGTLHTIAIETDQDVDPWYTTPPTSDRLHSLADQANAEHRAWAGALADVLPALLDLAASVRQIERTNVRWCHRDLHPSNLLPRVGGDVAVLDWENLGPLGTAQEVGSQLISWCTDGRHASADAVTGFLHGYRRVDGPPLTVARDTFTTAVATWLNFLAIQGEAALYAETPPEHRAFAEQQLQQLLSRPLTAALLGEVIRAAR